MDVYIYQDGHLGMAESGLKKMDDGCGGIADQIYSVCMLLAMKCDPGTQFMYHSPSDGFMVVARVMLNC